MKIPKRLKIGGHIVTVKIVEIPKEDCDGDFSTYGNLIRIDKRLPQSQREVTLIHEIFHALNSVIDDKNPAAHSLIESISQQFYQVLKDNKLLRD